MALTEKLTSIADAIRTKTGTTNTMTLEEMATAISAIPSSSGDWTYVDITGTYSTSSTEYTYGCIQFDLSNYINLDEVDNYYFIGHRTNGTNADPTKNIPDYVSILSPMLNNLFRSGEDLNFLGLPMTQATTNKITNSWTLGSITDLTISNSIITVPLAHTASSGYTGMQLQARLFYKE